MSRFARILMMLLLLAAGSIASAQDLTGLARIDGETSAITDTRGGARLEIGLSQGVPYRVFNLAQPDRLVVDFREVDWTGLDPERFDQSTRVRAVRFGGFRPGWSRLVVDLERPMIVVTSDLRLDPESGAARLSIHLDQTDRATFDSMSGAPKDPGWTITQDQQPRRREPGKLTVLIDPGHGGIDPGAERDGLSEKDLMLLFGFDLRDALLRVDGANVVLTREDDRFVSLEQRVALAHQHNADLLISLHADTLAEGRAHGAAIYSLSEDASDEASALLAERHNRADILAGIDLTGSDDIVADVLLDLARLETRPRTEALARTLVAALKQSGVPLNRRPYRSAAFSVLKAADIPSILLEVGFMSSDRDFANLSDPVWRRKAAAALRDGLQAWVIEDEALRALVRQ